MLVRNGLPFSRVIREPSAICGIEVVLSLRHVSFVLVNAVLIRLRARLYASGSYSSLEFRRCLDESLIERKSICSGRETGKLFVSWFSTVGTKRWFLIGVKNNFSFSVIIYSIDFFRNFVCEQLKLKMYLFFNDFASRINGVFLLEGKRFQDF